MPDSSLTSFGTSWEHKREINWGRVFKKDGCRLTVKNENDNRQIDSDDGDVLGLKDYVDFTIVVPIRHNLSNLKEDAF